MGSHSTKYLNQLLNCINIVVSAKSNHIDPILVYSFGEICFYIRPQNSMYFYFNISSIVNFRARLQSIPYRKVESAVIRRRSPLY